MDLSQPYKLEEKNEEKHEEKRVNVCQSIVFIPQIDMEESC